MFINYCLVSSFISRYSVCVQIIHLSLTNLPMINYIRRDYITFPMTIGEVERRLLNSMQRL